MHTLNYRTERQTVECRNGDLVIEHIIPVFTDEQRGEVLKKVEEGLYDIFAGYAKHRQSPISMASSGRRETSVD